MDENNIPLHVYIGDFATTGYTGDLQYDGNEVIPTPPIIPGNPNIQGIPTGLGNVSEVSGRNKVLQDGQLLFVTSEGTFDVAGKRIM